MTQDTNTTSTKERTEKCLQPKRLLKQALLANLVYPDYSTGERERERLWLKLGERERSLPRLGEREQERERLGPCPRLDTGRSSKGGGLGRRTLLRAVILVRAPRGRSRLPSVLSL